MKSFNVTLTAEGIREVVAVVAASSVLAIIRAISIFSQIHQIEHVPDGFAIKCELTQR
jgi:hypothetical protein